MLEFGFPANIADTPADAPVMMIGQARATVIGLLVFLLYSRSQWDLIDLVMAVTIRQGDSTAASYGGRAILAKRVSAWGIADWTAPRD